MPRIASIRVRITLFILLLLAGAIGVYAWLAYGMMRDNAVTIAERKLAAGTAQLAAAVAESAGQIQDVAQTVATDPRVLAHLARPAEQTRAGARQSLAESATGTVAGAALLDANGQSLLDIVSEGVDRAQLPSDLPSPKPGITPLAGRDGKAGYAAIAPVERGDHVVGYVAHFRVLDLSAEARDLIQGLIGSEAQVYLANRSGDVWTDLTDLVAPRPLRLDGDLRTGSYDDAGEGRMLAVSTTVRGTPWAVAVAIPEGTVLAAPRAALGGLLGLGAVILLIAAAAAWIGSGRLTAYVSTLARGASALRSGDYDHRVPVSGRDEFATLGAAFNEMAEGISAAHGELRDTVEALAEAEGRHRAVRRRLEQVIESSQAVLFTYRPSAASTGLDWISDNVERIVGHPADEVARSGWWPRAIHPEDRERVRDRLESWDGDELLLEYRLLHADGSYRWVWDERRRVMHDDAAAPEVVGVLTDVTNFRSLEIAKEAAEAANRTKNEFLSRMSHELRTPMNAVLGFAQLLVMDTTTDENRESAEQIVRAGQHLLGLIDEVLDISTIESGRMSLSTEPVSVRQVVADSVALVQGMAYERAIRINVAMDGDLDPYVLADQQRLKQVMLNLLSNAVKYNRRGGTVTISCEMRNGGDGGLRIAVRDTGFGIPEARIHQLFEPFERLGAEQTAVEGTGLGLALSRGLVQAMDGDLGVESEQDVGSTFWIELPMAEQALSPDPAPPVAEPRVPPAPEDTHTVLFVEDNLANVRLMERVLRRRPEVRLMTAMQGSLGLDLAREHRPDLILLDLNLPDLAGDAILRQIRHDPDLRHTPVVMISGDATASQVQRLLDLGATAYLTKPFDIQDLLAQVDNAIAEAMA